MRTRLPLALATAAAFAAAVGCTAQPDHDGYEPEAIVWIAAPAETPSGLFVCSPVKPR